MTHQRRIGFVAIKTFVRTILLLSAGCTQCRCRSPTLVLAGAAREGAADRRPGVGAAAL